MRSLALSFGVLVTAAALPAQAQFGTSVPPTPKQSSQFATVPSGGFLGGGADDCASAQAIAGQGVFSFDQTGATIGAEGQNETLCYAFGTSGIDNDVWYSWTADASGATTVQTCGGTATDTKIAAYPGGGCPADGTALACNDDACGLQSSIQFDSVNGSTYVLQVGTFPGSSGGSGTFEVTTVTNPPGCPDHSDGTAENSLGLVAGGDIAMLQYFDCLTSIGCVEAAFGSPAFPDPTLDGLPVTVAVYSDTDNDPTNGLTLLATTAGTVSNASSDTFVSYSFDPPVDVNGSGWVAVIVECTVGGQFPVAFDQDFPNPDCWVAGDTTCNLDPNDLTNSDVGVLAMAAIGFPASWLLRASDIPCPTGGGPVGSAYCFGNNCPCMNDDPAAGCANSSGTGGLLAGSGSASVSADDLTFSASNLIPGQSATLFSGTNALFGGLGFTFGDGLRCAGDNVIRFATLVPDGNGDATWGPGLLGAEGSMAGMTRHWQGWYRDPSGPCASTFNLTNGVAITYTP